MTINFKNGCTAEEIAELCGGRLYIKDNRKIYTVTSDSRSVEPGALFVALAGENFNGCDYIVNAADAGAVCALCECEPTPEMKKRCNIIKTEDAVFAMGKLANAYRRTVDPLVVAVTGSVGKTTTKEFIYAVLSKKYFTHKTEGNFNNEIGLPLTVFKMRPTNTAAVFELGMSAAGEIGRLSKIAEPDIAVITNIGSSHIEYLGSRENIAAAKLEIKCGLAPNSKLVLCGDEPLLAGQAGAIYVAVSNKNADVHVDNITENNDTVSFDINYFGETVKNITLPVLGRHNVMNAAYAFTVGKLCGMTDDMIREGLLDYHTTGMRQNICRHGEITMIEDCYNASPESMRASLEVLNSLARNGAGVAVLGDMRELGEQSEKLHRSVGTFAAALTNLRLLITVGKRAEYIATAAIEAGFERERVMYFTDIDDIPAIGDCLAKNVKPGDFILFKASRAVLLERVINYYKVL